MASKNKKRKQNNSPFVPSALKEKTMRMKRRLYFTSSKRQQNKKETLQIIAESENYVS